VKLFTIGHSNHPLGHFLGLLRRHAIVAIADVRSHPVSKWAPHFRKSSLSPALADHGIAYLFLGNELGGRPEGKELRDADGRVDHARRARADDFLAGIERLVGFARNRPTTLMCAEEDPNRCHRRLLITPVLTERGIDVVHIRGDGRLQRERDLRDATGQRSLFE
jgi:uncharacterized protein (DUF488 family)